MNKRTDPYVLFFDIVSLLVDAYTAKKYEHVVDFETASVPMIGEFFEMCYEKTKKSL